MSNTRKTYPNGIKCQKCDAEYTGTGALKHHIKQQHPEMFNDGGFMCFQCFIAFKTMSDVRKHQWDTHKNQFNGLVQSSKSRKKHPLTGRRRSKRSIAQFKATIAAKRLVASKELTVRQHLTTLTSSPNGNTPGQLSATDLLAKFKEQRDLMITVCNMIEGVLNQ